MGPNLNRRGAEAQRKNVFALRLCGSAVTIPEFPIHSGRSFLKITAKYLS
jgi:hypothetical protein